MECICLAANEAGRDAWGLFGECATPADERLADAAGGDCFSIGTDENGAVLGWGSAFYGELLTERDQEVDNTTAVASANALAFRRSIASRESDHSANAASTSARATHVRTLLPPTQLAVPEKCVRVACGANHVLVIAEQGSVYAWGWNRHRQVVPQDVDVVPQPSRVVIPEPANTAIAVAGGGMHSLALDSHGRVWSWGDNSHGQLGVACSDRVSGRPTRVALSQPVREIAAGWAHSALLTVTHELFTCGWGLYHQLGHGATRDERVPRAVDALSGLDASCGGPVVQVACGSWHTAVRSAAGDVYSWGWGQDGQLGHGAGVTTQALPRVVTAAADGYFDADDAGHRAVDIACGARETLVLSANGDLHWWGRRGRARPSRTAWSALDSDQICARVRAGHAHALLLVKRKGSREPNAPVASGRQRGGHAA